MVATKILGSPQGTPSFYRYAEVYFPSMQALEACALRKAERALAHAVKILPGEHQSFWWPRRRPLRFAKGERLGEKHHAFQVTDSGY